MLPRTMRRQRPTRPIRPTIVRALGLYRSHLGMLVLLMLAIAAASLLGLGPALAIREIVDGAFRKNDGGYLNVLVLGMTVLIGLTVLAGVAQSYLSQTIGQQVMFELRDRMYRHLGSMSLRWFTSNRSGEMLSRINNDIGAVQAVVSETLAGVVGSLIIGGTTLALMFVIDWRLTLFCVAFIPLFIFPSRWVGGKQRQLNSEIQEEVARLNVHMQETLSVSGALLMKTYGREQYEAGEFANIAARLRDLNIRASMVGRWFGAGLTAFGSISPAVIYWYGGHRLLDGEATLGTVIAFTALLARLFGPVQALLRANVTVIASIALFERIFDYLDLVPEIADRPNAHALGRAAGAVAFEHVSFAYSEGSPVLHDVSFAAEAGQFVALVGHSGAGKTTSAYLVPRLYDADSGRVTIDGHDVRTLQLASVTANVGVVSQETYLFHDTIAENIRYGRPGATDAEVEEAARAANIHDFVAGLPNRYATVVGERGFRLSGGERQRIAIARALLKSPAVLILDEATSSVDSRTERAIQEALDRLTRGRTVLAIAHRLSTVLRADQILVFERGRIIERGTHRELIDLGGEYSVLYQQQFRAGDEAIAIEGQDDVDR